MFQKTRPFLPTLEEMGLSWGVQKVGCVEKVQRVATVKELNYIAT